MSQQRYTAVTTSALSTTAKTCLSLLAGAADRINALTELGVSVDTAALITVELCESTQAGAGTVGTAPTVKQVGGFSGADTTAPAQVTATGNYSVEPTVLTVLKHWIFQGPGPFVLQSPLGREVESLLSGSTKYKALALRLTASTGTPNAKIYAEIE